MEKKLIHSAGYTLTVIKDEYAPEQISILEKLTKEEAIETLELAKLFNEINQITDLGDASKLLDFLDNCKYIYKNKFVPTKEDYTNELIDYLGRDYNEPGYYFMDMQYTHNLRFEEHYITYTPVDIYVSLIQLPC